MRIEIPKKHGYIKQEPMGHQRLHDVEFSDDQLFILCLLATPSLEWRLKKATIMEELHFKYGFKLVMEEGAEGPVDTKSILALDYVQEARNKSIAIKLLQVVQAGKGAEVTMGQIFHEVDGVLADTWIKSHPLCSSSEYLLLKGVPLTVHGMEPPSWPEAYGLVKDSRESAQQLSNEYGLLVEKLGRDKATVVPEVERRLGLLVRIAAVQVTPQEVQPILDNPDMATPECVATELRRFGVELPPSIALLLEQALPPMLRYYMLLEQRHEAFVDNTLRKMEEMEEKRAILSCLGFHSLGIHRILHEKHKDVRHVFVFPQVEETPLGPVDDQLDTEQMHDYVKKGKVVLK